MKPRLLSGLFRAFAIMALALATAPIASAGAPSGTALYKDNCGYCHGPKGEGDGPNGVKLRPRAADLTKSRLDQKAIERVVRDGKRACPSWKSSLSEEEIAAVAAFARSLRR